VNATWQGASRTLRRDLLDGTLLLPDGAAEPLSLSASATEIWESVQQPTSTEAVVARLADRHGVPPDALRDEVVGAIDGLVAAGAVEAVPDASRREATS